MKDIFIVMHSSPMRKKKDANNTLHIFAVDPHILSVFDRYEAAVEYIENVHSNYQKNGAVWFSPVKTLPGNNEWESYGRIWIEGEFILKD